METCILCGRKNDIGIICDKCLPQTKNLIQKLMNQFESLEKALNAEDSAKYLSIAKSHDKSAWQYFLRRDYGKALEFYKKVLTIREKYLDKEHPDVVQSYKNIAAVYHRQADEAAAKQAKIDENPLQAAKRPIFIDKEKLYAELSSKIFGQDKALRALSSIVRIHLVKTPKFPVSILAAGATGCGKTESVIMLVETLNKITDRKFGFIRVDCNLLVNQHHIELAGSSQGYRDSGEPNMFTVLCDQPRQIILFDEIEKADRRLLTSIMGILDYGKLQLLSPLKEKDKDGKPIKGNEGKEGVSEIDFRYAIIVFTSNLSLDPTVKKFGFFVDADDNSSESANEQERCREALVKSGTTLPEVAGRIGYFLQYVPLTEEDTRKIIRLEIEKCANSFDLSAETIDDVIVDEIVQAIGKTGFGARAHRSYIEHRLSETFIEYLQSEPETKTIELAGSLDAIRIVPTCYDFWNDGTEYPF